MDREFPTDHFRQYSPEREPLPWTRQTVEQAVSLHFNLGRLALNDERLTDVWDAVTYILISARIFEGWLIDWNNWIADNRNPRPDPEASLLLLDFCRDALWHLIVRGVIRTDLVTVSETLHELMLRFPPFENFGKRTPRLKSRELWTECCVSLVALFPLFGAMQRIQDHFENNEIAELEFLMVNLPGRATGRFPGSLLRVWAGIEPADFRNDIHLKPAKLSDAADREEIPSWSEPTLELFFRGQRVKKVKNRYAKFIDVLNAFESHNWEKRIDVDYEYKVLNNMLQSLNKNLKLLKFRVVDSGQGVIWDAAE